MDAVRTSGRHEPLLEVRDLKKWFPIKKGLLGKVVGHVKAVDGVSFALGRGETLGLVGESGCGKTTVGRTILRLIDPTAGHVQFDGKSVFDLDSSHMRALREDMQIIFQDPYSSLNPRMTVAAIVGEALLVHGIVKTKAEARDRVAELLERVGLSPKYVNRYPHEFSGGQRQRIGIARALAMHPKFIVCDEAVSALDVSIQAQILNILMDLQEDESLGRPSYLFIAHDLSVVRHISRRIAVMYLGQIVELSMTEELFDQPSHPYTRALLSAIPRPDPDDKPQRILLEGDVPTPINPPSGCHFHTRCPEVMPRCSQEEPPAFLVSGTHAVQCWLYDGKAPVSETGMTVGFEV
ncbi:MAG: ABC transporter ATP-binding protein [Planctomycetes bacterium]|nr:ABC transporter ATP-binding protein [Planctomycetota bacterium]